MYKQANKQPSQRAMKHVLISCSMRARDTDFTRHGGDDAMLNVLQMHGFSAPRGVNFIFVDPLADPSVRGHVRNNLLPFLESIATPPTTTRTPTTNAASRRRPRLDAIVLMGCNSIGWLLEGYSPTRARSILHDALAPNGLLLVFETRRLMNLETHTARRIARGLVMHDSELDAIAQVFAPTHWTRLDTGVYKKKATTARQTPRAPNRIAPRAPNRIAPRAPNRIAPRRRSSATNRVTRQVSLALSRMR
jgi:hypothetical protein